MFDLFGDEKVVRFYNLLLFQNESEGQRIIDLFQSRFINKTGIRWGIALKGTTDVIGTIGYNSYTINHKATIGYDLLSAHWNKGLATEALKKNIEYGFNQLQINRIEAGSHARKYCFRKCTCKIEFQKRRCVKRLDVLE